MFDELTKYKQGNFFFQVTDSLSEVCNLSNKCYGIYLVYGLCKGKVELIYIGKSAAPEGKRAAGAANVDLRQDLLNGYQFDETERKNAWPVQMMIEDIEALHIHWYITYDEKHNDLPASMKTKILQIYQSIYGRLPRWNVG